MTQTLPLSDAVSPQRRLAFFGERLRQAGDCWGWTGAVHVAAPEKGGARYGRAQFWVGGVVVEQWYAHRLSWFLHRSEIPAGLTIDHLCRNTICVNPEHLDPVPSAVNNRRAANHHRSTHPSCPQGHDDWVERRSSGLGRYCAECARIRTRKNKQRRAA